MMYDGAMSHILSHLQMQCSPTANDGAATQGIISQHDVLQKYS